MDVKIMKCSICKEIGHKGNNTKFHPVKEVAELPLEIVKLTDEIVGLFAVNFDKCVKGYHLINNVPIKEAPWEDINTIILDESGFPVLQNNGSHKPGQDLLSPIGGFSNKSTKYGTDQTSFMISSYRLSKECSDNTPGDIEAIITEIGKRKNFAYYSIIARNESEGTILYDWYLIPSDFSAFDPSSYEWIPKLGKSGKKKGSVIGWETNIVDGSSMTITFSMSSQLWINVNITEDMRKFIVGSSTVVVGKKYNYIQLYEKEC